MLENRRRADVPAIWTFGRWEQFALFIKMLLSRRKIEWLIWAINNFDLENEKFELGRKVSGWNFFALQSHKSAINKLIVDQWLYNKINSNHNNELNQVFVQCPSRWFIESRSRQNLTLIFLVAREKNPQRARKTIFYAPKKNRWEVKRDCDKLFINVLIE